jgi:hypothetical protein
MSVLPDYLTAQQANLETAEVNKILTQFKVALQTRKWNQLPRHIRALNNCLSLRISFTPQQRQEIIDAAWKSFQEPVSDFHLKVKMSFLSARVLKQAAKRRDKLTVSWEPMYIHLKELLSKRTLAGPIAANLQICAVRDLVRQARKFFPSSAATEIWKTLTPRLALHDVHVFRVQWLLTQLLPTHDPQSWTIWGAEGVAIWRWIDHTPAWAYNWVALYARLARHQVLEGHGKLVVDTATLATFYHQSIILAELTTVFQSTTNDIISLLPHELGTALFTKIGQFMAYTLSDNDDHLTLFTRFVSQLSTYFYPSNKGKWSDKLAAWLLSVTRRLVERVREAERHNGQGALSLATLQRVVRLLLPLASAVAYSKNSVLNKAGPMALKYLAYLSLNDTLTLQLNRFVFALETLTATHQLVPTLDALSLMMESLVCARDRQGPVEGVTSHLANFLLQTSPAIDSNDVPKTQHALKLYYAFVTHVPLIATDDSVNMTNLSNDKESVNVSSAILKERRLVSAVFHDWALDWFDRTLTFLYNRDRPSQEESWPERIFRTMFEHAHTALFMQASPSLHAQLQQRLLNYVQSEMCLNAKREFGYLCAACVAAQPDTSVRAFVTALCHPIVAVANSPSPHRQQETATSFSLAFNEGETSSDVFLAENELVWRTHLLAKVCRYGGIHLLAHRTELLTVLRVTLADTRRDVVRAGGKLLRNLLYSLTMNYPLESRSLSPPLWASALTSWAHLRLWGHYSPSLDVLWHHPTSSELQWAREVFLAATEPSMNVLRKVIETKVVSVGHDVWRALFVLRCALRGGSVALNDVRSEETHTGTDTGTDTDTDTISAPREVFAFASVSTTVSGALESDRELPWREHCARTLDHFVQTLLTLPSVPPLVLKQVALLIYTLLTHYGVSARKVKRAKESYNLFQRTFVNQSLPCHRLTRRALRIEKAHLLHLWRLSLRASAARWHTLHSALLTDLLQVYLHNPRTFKKLIPKITDCLKRAGALEVAIKHLCARLSDSAAGEETLHGIVSLLNERYVLQRIVRNWQHKHTFLRHLLHADRHDIPHFQSKLHELFIHFCLVISPSLLTLPLTSLTYTQLSDAEMHTAQGKLTRANKRNVSHFVDIWREVIEQVASGSSHWRYEVMGATVLLLLSCPLPSSFPKDLFRKTLEWALTQLSAPLPLLRSLAAKLLHTLLILHRLHKSRSAAVRIPFRVTLDIALNGFVSLPLWDAGYLGWNGPVLVAPPVATDWDAISSDTTAYSLILQDTLRQHFGNAKTFDTLLQRLVNDHHYASPEEQSQEQVTQLIRKRLQNLSHAINVNFIFSFAEKEAPHHDILQQLLLPQRVWHNYRVPLHHEAFSELHAALWSEVSLVLGPDSVSQWAPHVTTLLTGNSTRGTRCVAAELLAGLTRSMTRLSADSSTLSLLAHLWHTLLKSATLEDDKDLTYAIRYATHQRDPRRLSFLYQLLIPPPLTLASTQTDSKLLRCAVALLAEGGWRAVSGALSLARTVIAHMSHHSAQLRQDIATALYIALDLLIQVPRDEHDRPSILVAPTPSPAQIDIVEQIWKQWIQHEKDVTSEALLRCRETLITLVNVTLTHNSDALTLFAPRFLPILFAATVETNEEIRHKAHRTLELLVHVSLPQHFLQSLNNPFLAVIHNVARSTNWHIRKELLSFLQVAVFNHAFSMSQEVLNEITDVVLNMLRDERIEVRDAARVALTSLCKTVPLNLNDLIARFKSWVEGHDALHRHAGVLGIRSLIESAPYTIPSWLPELLAYQAKLLRTSSKQPLLVTQTASETLQEFWRTHRDDWELCFKPCFSKEQLDLIQQRTTPSYYA